MVVFLKSILVQICSDNSIASAVRCGEMILRVVHILTSASKSSDAWREITLACLSWSIVSGQDVPTVCLVADVGD